jgi:hypothetical protein
MPEGPSFTEPLKTGGRRERRGAALVSVLLIASLGILIAKPWGGPDDSAPYVAPSPVVAPTEAVIAPPAPSLQTTAPAVPSAAPSIAVAPLPVSFTRRLSSPSATWTGVSWRRLAPDDPLNLVTSTTRWRRGFIAIGSEAALPATPVWTSADGSRWDALPFNTSTTFWPGMFVLGVEEVPTGLVAVTETAQYCGEPCALAFVLPVVSWTSPDGRRWTPHVLPQGWFASPEGQPPLVAAGPAGLVAASSGPTARLATSTDGTQWRLLPAGTFPAGFALNDLRGTATGYVAVGRWVTTDNNREPVALWSSDGEHWPQTPTHLPTMPETGSSGGAVVESIIVGRDGIIALGRGATIHSATLWWRSPDGRRWTALPDFPPLGSTTCTDQGCGLRPDGALAGDGNRMVTVRGGADAGVWTSSDGLAWQRLPVAGDIPREQATEAALLPGGVLLSDGTTTWYGEAVR